MLALSDSEKPVYGLVTNGGSFLFVKLVKQGVPKYALSRQESNDALRQKLCGEIIEYETLVAHNSKEALVLEIEDMNYLPHLLIKARIALKLTPKELATLSDHTEEEIIAFEAKNYHNASFVNFLAVSKALGIKVIAGKFVAQMDDFYTKELIDMRQAQVESINTVAAS